MRRRLAAVFLIFTAACAAPKGGPKIPDNFEVMTYEVVDNPEGEGVSHLKIFVDGAEAGQTAAGPKSSEKIWQGRLAPGNRLIRLEYWVLPGFGDWERLGADFQPRERFMRVEEGFKTKVAVKFSEKGRKNQIQLTREPL